MGRRLGIFARQLAEYATRSLIAAEILEVAQKWAAKTDALIEPEPVPARIDKERVCRVVTPPHFCWRPCAREKTLPDARPGPRLRAEQIRREVMSAP